MPIHARVAGSYQLVRATGVHVRVSSVWQQCKSAWVRDGGTWRRLFERLQTATMTIGTAPSTFYGWDFDTTMGDLTPYTFTDYSGTPLQWIRALYHYSGDGRITLRLDQTGIADSDAIFRELVINGNVLRRADRVAYFADGGQTDTVWQWTSSNIIGTSGTIGVEVWG